MTEKLEYEISDRAEQRVAQLAKANAALRDSLDQLASVPQLDEFIGQVMAAITGQLGAVSSVEFEGQHQWHFELSIHQ